MAQVLPWQGPEARDELRRLIRCLSDETLARILLAGLVTGPEPLSLKTSETLAPKPTATATSTPAPMPMPTPTQIPGRDDLYGLIQPPEHMAYVWWGWNPSQAHFRELATEFTIHNDVEDWSDGNGLYLMLCYSSISGIGFYFGLQTDVHASEYPYHRGKGAIFSRWDTRDLANARYSETDGWSESSGHEGDFIGVRRPYDWGSGDYRISIAPDGRDSDGEWFGLWVTDLSTNETTWIGSLKFPLLNGTATIEPSSYATLEIYGPGIRPIDIPQWHVSVKRPLGDNAPSNRGFTGYSAVRENPLLIQNSNIWYDQSEGQVHLQVGGHNGTQQHPHGDG